MARGRVFVSRIVVTDGGERSALAVVRSLGRAGHDVSVLSDRTRSLAGASRHARDEHRVASPLSDPERFLQDVARWSTDWEADLLLPMTDASLDAVLAGRERLPGVRVPFPDRETFRAVSDKVRVTAAARELGIAVPAQVELDAPEDLGEAARLRFPVVVKPGRSVVPGAEGRLEKTGVVHAADRGELERSLREMPEAAFPLLVQERIVGYGTGVFLLLWDGEVKGAFCHRRIREKPPSGGVSVLRESVPLEAGLLETSRRLLASFGWRGVAMVEYKRDTRTETPYLMEVNGRFWGSLQLAVDAGVDFPRLLVDAAEGRTVEPVIEYRTGVRTRWLAGDLDHLLLRLSRSREDLALDGSAPGRARAVGRFLASFGPGTRNEVFRWRDPMPAVSESVSWVRSLWT